MFAHCFTKWREKSYALKNFQGVNNAKMPSWYNIPGTTNTVSLLSHVAILGVSIKPE